MLPSPTATASPTPLPPCTGDCDGSRIVSLREVVDLLSLALNGGSRASCRGSDPEADDEVPIDEVISAVNNAQSGCTNDGP